MANTKVISVRPLSSEQITAKYYEDQTTVFIRYSPDHWEEQMGESMEQVYDCEYLEAAYQAFKKGSAA